MNDNILLLGLCRYSRNFSICIRISQEFEITQGQFSLVRLIDFDSRKILYAINIQYS